MWTWITAGDSRVCPDCAPRHGVNMALDNWDSVGRPGDGLTICADFCRCLLIREDLLLRTARSETVAGALEALNITRPIIVMSGAEQAALIDSGLPLLAEMDYETARIMLIDEIRAIENIDGLEFQGLYSLIKIYENLSVI